jgi:hypothetical protein
MFLKVSGLGMGMSKNRQTTPPVGGSGTSGQDNGVAIDEEKYYIAGKTSGAGINPLDPEELPDPVKEVRLVLDAEEMPDPVKELS